MDGMKVLAKAVILVGGVWVWPGPAIVARWADRAPGVSPLPSTKLLTRTSSGGAAWLQDMRPRCNAVEVELHVSRTPAPAGWEGRAHEAACYALAGRISRARQILTAIPGEHRWRAAGVVFEAAHPVADAGDDAAAGPSMELVVEFWPNHYMALYHAGAARYAGGAHDEARSYLERFLDVYGRDDGWRRNATVMLQQMAESGP